MRLAGEQTTSPILEAPMETGPPGGSLPDWVRGPPPPEPDPPKPLFPSRTSEAEPPVLSPLGMDGRDRFKRGLLAHRLLQGHAMPWGEITLAAVGCLIFAVLALAFLLHMLRVFRQRGYVTRFA